MKINPADLDRALQNCLISATAKKSRVTIPAPPSSNHLFRGATNHKTGKSIRVKSNEYTAWIASVLGEVAALAPPASYPCRYRLLLTGKWNVLRDGENAQKAVLDVAVKAGVIPDDSLKYIWGGEWSYRGGVGEPMVTLWFEATV
jgi:Holliday junction resolvase RusA-like endonuclease